MIFLLELVGAGSDLPIWILSMKSSANLATLRLPPCILRPGLLPGRVPRNRVALIIILLGPKKSIYNCVNSSLP